MFVCRDCRLEKPDSDKSRVRGGRCKLCYNESRRDWRAARPKVVFTEEQLKRRREYYHEWKNADNGEKYRNHHERMRKRGQEHQEAIQEIKTELGCARCANQDFRVLHFHHKDPESKNHNIANMKGMSWERVLEEISKCEVLCANCHAIEHYERRE